MPLAITTTTLAVWTVVGLSRCTHVAAVHHDAHTKRCACSDCSCGAFVVQVAKVVAPKKAKLAEAEASYQEVMVGLTAKQKELQVRKE